MTQRAYIRNGDATNVGGIVETPPRKDRLDGKELAYEKDPVWCPQCRAYGYIVCTGPRSPSKSAGGLEAALADDLCACKCRPFPILIASQSHSFSRS
jgi:uncharacterized Zn-binding protein involved in type VI secretion